jgi:hypothetical protein
MVNPAVWANRTPGRARNAMPVKVLLEEGASSTHLKQYSSKQEALERIQPILRKILKYYLICLCQSPYNTPMLPVKKPPSEEYHFGQVSF